MAKEKPASDAPDLADKAIPLDEFCIRLSKTEPRVELISGFHHTEQAAGRGRDLPAAYQDRFNKFMKKPV